MIAASHVTDVVPMVHKTTERISYTLGSHDLKSEPI